MILPPKYIEQRIIAALKAAPEVSALCCGRVFPLRIPQGVKLPAVVVQRTYSSPDYTLAGYSSESAVLMVNSFSLIWEKAKELALAVRGAMAAEKAILRNETDVHEHNNDAFCISAEYVCQQSGGFDYGD